MQQQQQQQQQYQQMQTSQPFYTNQPPPPQTQSHAYPSQTEYGYRPDSRSSSLSYAPSNTSSAHSAHSAHPSDAAAVLPAEWGSNLNSAPVMPSDAHSRHPSLPPGESPAAYSYDHSMNDSNHADMNGGGEGELNQPLMSDNGSNSESEYGSGYMRHRSKEDSTRKYAADPDDDGWRNGVEKRYYAAKEGGGGMIGTLKSYMRRAWDSVRLSRHRPWRAAQVVVGLIVAVLILRFLFHAYQDRSKFDNLSVVSIMRDMSPQAAKADPSLYAFQYIALQSWSQLVVGSHILLFVEKQEQCPYVESLVRGVQCIPVPCWHADYSRPMLNCIFQLVHERAPTDTVVFVHSDLALYPDLAQAIKTVSSDHDKFALVGRRTDTLVSSVMLEEFRSTSFPARLKAHAINNGQMHSPFTIDMIAYRKKVLTELKVDDSDSAGSNAAAAASLPTSPGSVRFPAFLAGGARWDNWLLSQLLLDDSVTVVDVSNSVLLVHMELSHGRHQDRVALPYNDQLAKSLNANQYKIGSVDNAPYILEGQCGSTASGASGCSLTSNPNVSDVVLFNKKASKDGYLVVLTVNHVYITLALNWVCWAERIKFNNYILIAEDQSSGTFFQSRGVAVLFRKDAPWIKKAGDYGSVEFQETMTFRTEFLMTVLNAGFHFVTADMDGLWLDDPLRYMNPTADLQGQMHKVTKISGGLVIVRASTYGRYFWQMVIECQRANAAFLATAKEGTYVPATYTEQYCINQLSLGLATEPRFSRSLLDPYLFPDGKSFFDEHQSQYRGIWPSIIHNNWIVGTGNKLNRLKQWKLDSADEEAKGCKPLERLPNPKLEALSAAVQQLIQPSEEEAAATASQPAHTRQHDIPEFNPPLLPLSTRVATPFHLKIRIFAFTDVVSLRRLLDSLSATEWEGDRSSVSLEISIDRPPVGASQEQQNGWQAVQALANAFEWNHAPGQSTPASGVGSKHVIQQTQHIGVSGQYLTGWTPNAANDNELMLFLMDDVVLAPSWYQWMKRVLLKYYATPAQFDPRLMGISLTEQRLIVGETHERRFMPASMDQPHLSSVRPPSEIINHAAQYYKYQLFSSTNGAQLFFPQHWRVFQSWLAPFQIDPSSGVSLTGASPCVPTMISNTWFKTDPAKHWYAWLIRFAFEKGYYILYTNFDDGSVFAVRARGQAAVTEHLSRLVKDLSTLPKSLPSSSATLVYDFHFNRVSTPDVLAWRKHIVAPHVLDQCWTMDQLEKKLADDAAAEAEAERIKQEAKAKAAAEKKAKAEAEKKKKKAEEEAKKKKAAAEKKKKDEEEKKKKKKKEDEEKKKKAAAAAAKKKKESEEEEE